MKLHETRVAPRRSIGKQLHEKLQSRQTRRTRGEARIHNFSEDRRIDRSAPSGRSLSFSLSFSLSSSSPFSPNLNLPLPQRFFLTENLFSSFYLVPLYSKFRYLSDRWNRFVFPYSLTRLNERSPSKWRKRQEGKERREREKLEEANLRNEYDSCKIHRTIRDSLNVACLSVCLRAYFRSHLYARISSSVATCSGRRM